MAVKLIWRHQQRTYELMKAELKRTKKAAFVYPTGGGKSFPPLKYIEEPENADKNVLIVTPSLFINNQFEKYIKNYVENGAERIKNKKIATVTYQKISLLKSRVKNLKPDIIIFDEIHRMGAEKWEDAVDLLIESFPEAEIIGMSATPERLDKRNMAYEKFGDSVVYEMSLTEALTGEKENEVVLNSPKYYRVLSTLRPIADRYKAEIELLDDGKEKEELLRRFQKLDTIIGKSPDIPNVMQEAMKDKPNGKYIVYCKDRNDLEEKMRDAQFIFGKVNTNINCDYVISRYDKKDSFGKSKKQNRKTIENFENLNPGESLNLLFCVDMLNEGSHVDGVDGEILFDLTKSPIQYKQRIGRVLSADKKAGETVIVDPANNWLEQLETYRELETAIVEGGKRENPEYDDRKNYDLLQLTAEETELLEVLQEIGEKLKYNKKTFLTRAREIKQWCEAKYADKPREERLFPSVLSSDKEEKSLAMALSNIKSNIVKRYEDMELSEIDNLEHREIVEIIRYLDENYKMINKKYDIYGDIIDWLDAHNGKLPRDRILENGVEKTKKQRNEEEQKEVVLRFRWGRSEEKRILDEYINQDIENVPEEFRERIRKLRSYGLGFEKENKGIKTLIEICRILKEKYNVDLSNIQLSERRDNSMYSFSLSEIRIDNLDMDRVIAENEFDKDFPFGKTVKELRKVYKGSKNDLKVSEETLKEALELGIIIDKQEKLDKIEAEIQILETLKQSGVPLNQGLSKRITDENGKNSRYYYKLFELQTEGIDIERIIEENGLDRNLVINDYVSNLRLFYNQNDERLNPEQRKRIEQLGLIKDKKHPYLDRLETIEDWIKLYGDAPHTKAHPKNESEEEEDRLARTLGNITQYVKSKEDSAERTPEEEKIISKYRSIIKDKKHPYLELLDDIQRWQEKNNTTKIPVANTAERKLPEDKRSEEYSLGKRKENLQNTFLKKYKDISEEEFESLPDETKEIITRCAQMGIGLKFDLIKRMKSAVAKHVGTNEEVRAELLSKTKNLSDGTEPTDN